MVSVVSDMTCSFASTLSSFFWKFTLVKEVQQFLSNPWVFMHGHGNEHSVTPLCHQTPQECSALYAKFKYPTTCCSSSRETFLLHLWKLLYYSTNIQMAKACGFSWMWNVWIPDHCFLWSWGIWHHAVMLFLLKERFHWHYELAALWLGLEG